jgi:crotonobetainyl-CoA:carnitine CoA-transferase CaiB-like acyl-CoA transferase
MNAMGIQPDHAADADSSEPLRGCRILEFGNRLTAYCGKALADLGADVILVERPTGNDLRFAPPFRDQMDGLESSLTFAYYQHNKRGVTLNWSSDEALPLLEVLARDAQVVLYSPDERQPLAGFDPGTASIHWQSEHTHSCFITPFGLTGPLRNWRATPFTSFAMSGLMHPVGPPEGPPIAQPGQQLYDESGLHAAMMIQSLLLRHDTEAQSIDVSAHEVGWFHKISLERYGMQGRIATRETNFGPPPGGIWQCKDGLIDIATHALSHWGIFLEVIDRPAVLMDPIYEDRGMRVQLYDMLTEMIAELLSTKSAKELVERGQAAGLPCALMYTPDEFLDDIQPRERGFFVESTRDGTGTFEMPGRPFRARPDLLSYRRPAPSLGEHNEEIYVEELGCGRSDLASWSMNELI